MASAAEQKLAELGHTIPDAPAPAANYVPFVISGNLVFVSGQISMASGAPASPFLKCAVAFIGSMQTWAT